MTLSATVPVKVVLCIHTNCYQAVYLLCKVMIFNTSNSAVTKGGILYAHGKSVQRIGAGGVVSDLG